MWSARNMDLLAAVPIFVIFFINKNHTFQSIKASPLKVKPQESVTLKQRNQRKIRLTRKFISAMVAV
jgi:hypothetical protein